MLYFLVKREAEKDVKLEDVIQEEACLSQLVENQSSEPVQRVKEEID